MEKTLVMDKPRPKIRCLWSKIFLYGFLAFELVSVGYALVSIGAVLWGPRDILLLEHRDNSFAFTLNQVIYTSFTDFWDGTREMAVTPQAAYCIFLALGLLAEKLPTLAILVTVQRILLQTTKEERPFSETTVKSVRFIGIVLVLSGLFSGWILQSGTAGLIFHTVYYRDPQNWLLVFVGTLILVLAGIFHYGCELQAEADQTL